MKHTILNINSNFLASSINFFIISVYIYLVYRVQKTNVSVVYNTIKNIQKY